MNLLLSSRTGRFLPSLILPTFPPEINFYVLNIHQRVYVPYIDRVEIHKQRSIEKDEDTTYNLREIPNIMFRLIHYYINVKVIKYNLINWMLYRR